MKEVKGLPGERYDYIMLQVFMTELCNIAGWFIVTNRVKLLIVFARSIGHNRTSGSAILVR